MRAITETNETFASLGCTPNLCSRECLNYFQLLSLYLFWQRHRLCDSILTIGLSSRIVMQIN